MLVGLLAWGVDVGAAHAASFTVTTTGDEGQFPPVGTSCTNTPSGQCSLRAAIQAANALGGGPHTIRLTDGATYTLSVVGQGEDAAATGDLDVTASIRLFGGVDHTVVQAGTDAANGVDRVFDVQSGGTLNATGLTIRHGNPGNADGGAIRNRGTLLLNVVTVRDSTVGSLNVGGGIANI